MMASHPPIQLHQVEMVLRDLTGVLRKDSHVEAEEVGMNPQAVVAPRALVEVLIRQSSK